jgi:hypothetical protein
VQADAAAGAPIPPHLLELLAVVHAFKSLRLRLYLLDKPFELHWHTDKLGQREP